MNVKEMVSLMRTLGIGEVYNDKESEEIYLRFLRLAHDKLYSITAALNDDLYITETISSVPNEKSIILSQDPFIIDDEIWCETTSSYVVGCSVKEFNRYKRENRNPGYPTIYSNVKRVINFTPIAYNIPYIFEVDFKPDVNRFEINTPESAIPYPISFHWVLVSGALYYLFHDESGFKNTIKEKSAEKEWEDGKKDLISYLYGRSKQTNSMYERI